MYDFFIKADAAESELAFVLQSYSNRFCFREEL